MHDKLLLGLVIICILGVFFTGTSKDDGEKRGRGPKISQGEEHAPGESQPQGTLPGQNPSQSQGQGQGQNPAQGQPGAQGQNQGQGQTQQANANQENLTPNLAGEFVRWWLTKGMDYKQASAAASHKEAFGWALPDATNVFEQLFWGDHIKQGIATGTIAADFQPISVTPLAINPDGSVVVTVVGTLCMQQTGQMPASQQLTMDFLVKKGTDGCRIAGFYNKAAIPVGR